MDNLEKIQEDTVNQLDNQPKGEFISLYDLIEWAKTKNSRSLINATYDIFTILKEECSDAFAYEYLAGIKLRTIKTDKKLSDYVLALNLNKGYKKTVDNFDDDIPF